MNLSQAARRQLYGLCVVRGVIDSMREVNPTDTVIDQLGRRALKKQREILAKLVPLNPDYTIDFGGDVKKERLFRRGLQKVYDELLGQWPQETLDGREYCNAVLAYLDDIRAGKLKQDFTELQGLIHDIYQQMDPEMDADEQMDIGESACAHLLGALEE